MTEVSIIIVNYNTKNLVTACIRSIIDFTERNSNEIILVDNASTECDPENFLIEFPQIKLVRSDRNGGFAYGNNLGIKNSVGDIIVLLNSDTLLTEDSIAKAATYLRSNPGVGVLGCRMSYPDGKIQYTARRFRSIGWELMDLFRFVPYLLSYPARSRKMLGKYFRHDEEVSCDWVNGAFFMIARKIIDQLPGGQLDDRFFMYGEDQLWCEQVKNLGYNIQFYPGTTIIHINSGSTMLSNQLKLRKIMRRHELEIMKLRKGSGIYYQVFKCIYVSKEVSRNTIKYLYFKLTGRLLR